ncbi:MAG: hypothetical protein GC160_20200 [Acidobacteria bacterium]|nr:hypothetical protein [Acidobacteriota bacterium]
MRVPPVLALLATSFCFSPPPLAATLVPEVGFETLVADSEAIVHGTVVRSWTAWDEGHAAIWTHYEVRVASWLKGSPASTIRISEPGGSVGGVHTQIVGAPRYAVGEEIVVFAHRTPIGYLRTSGWSQGKFVVSAGGSGSGNASGKIVSSVRTGAQIVSAAQPVKTPLSSLDRSDLAQFLARVRAEVARGGSQNGGGLR